MIFLSATWNPFQQHDLYFSNMKAISATLLTFQQHSRACCWKFFQQHAQQGRCARLISTDQDYKIVHFLQHQCKLHHALFGLHATFGLSTHQIANMPQLWQSWQKNDCDEAFLNSRKVFPLPSSDLFPWKNGQLVKNSEKLKCGDHKSFERKSLCSKSYNCSFNRDKDRNTSFGWYITI